MSNFSSLTGSGTLVHCWGAEGGSKREREREGANEGGAKGGERRDGGGEEGSREEEGDTGMEGEGERGDRGEGIETQCSIKLVLYEYCIL